jgi:hypothetical protein
MSLRIYNGHASRNAALVGAAWMAIILIVTAAFNPRTAAAGWLVGFVFWAQILTGSLTLIMLHRLTGGRWGTLIAPVVEPAAAALPLLIVLAVPLFFAIPVLYQWPHHPAEIKPDVLSYYLNKPSFIARSLLALAGWSALAWLLPRIGGRHGLLLAALGLVFHALVISGISIDWYLSLEAPFNSSSFGASVAITALVGALALAAVFVPASDDDPALGDLGGLLLATILGITYIDFMAVLVIWYGDLPPEELWFVERNNLLWSALAIASFLLVSLLPVLALLLARMRNARRPLRVIGGCVLVGLACYDAYLIGPRFGAATLLTAVVAVIGIGLGLIGLFASAATGLIYRREPVDVH